MALPQAAAAMKGGLSVYALLAHSPYQLNKEKPMNPRAVGIAFLVISPVWFWLALESLGRGKTVIAILQLAVGLAFAGRGIVEWRKQAD